MITSPQPYDSPSRIENRISCFVVARAVRLDARAEVARRADGDAVAGERIEERARDRRRARRRSSPSRPPRSPRWRARRRCCRAHAAAPGPSSASRMSATVRGSSSPSQLRSRVRSSAARHAIVDERRAADVADRRREQRAPRLVAQAVVGRAADGEVAFLEGAGEREDAAQFAVVHVSSRQGSRRCRGQRRDTRIDEMQSLKLPDRIPSSAPRSAMSSVIWIVPPWKLRSPYSVARHPGSTRTEEMQSFHVRDDSSSVSPHGPSTLSRSVTSAPIPL